VKNARHNYPKDTPFWSFVTLTVLGGAVVASGVSVARTIAAALKKEPPDATPNPIARSSALRHGAELLKLASVKNVRSKRLPKVWTTIQSDAALLPRFEFIARFVAFMTKSEAGRKLAAGMQVVLTDDGWVFGFHDIGPSCAPCGSAKLYEMILRSPLNHFVREAEDYRQL
jgi:hypothetical protein